MADSVYQFLTTGEAFYDKEKLQFYFYKKQYTTGGESLGIAIPESTLGVDFLGKDDLYLTFVPSGLPIVVDTSLESIGTNILTLGVGGVIEAASRAYAAASTTHGPENWVENSTFDFQFEKLYNFSELDGWSKWILLSRDIEREEGGAKQGDKDYNQLLEYALLNKAKEKWNNSSNDKEFISERIKISFNKFLTEIKESDGSLSEIKIKFFKEYSALCTNKDLVSKLRVEITKKTGESDFIADNFGINEKFDFDSFLDNVQEEIRKKIDSSSTYDEGVSVAKSVPNSGGWYFPASPTEKIRYTKSVSENNPLIHGSIAAPGDKYTVSRDILKESEIYDNAASYDVIEGWRKSESFYVPSTTFDNYGGKFGDLYDPTTEKTDWFDLKFDKSNITTGPDDVSFVYFLKFINEIKLDIQDSGQLTARLGSTFDDLAKQAARYILPRVVRVYEQNRRKIIAVKLSQQDDDYKPSLEEQEKAFLEAEEQAKSSLSDIDTSNIGKEDPSDEDISGREKKYKQCVLLLNLPTLKADFNKEILRKKLENTKMHAKGLYNKRFTMLEDRSNIDDQNGLINKLITPKAEKIRPFLNMTNELYAALVPKIRLFKIYYDPSEGKKNPYLTREIPFKSHTSTKRVEMLSKPNTFDKGDGYGIKSFNFSFDGETPATSTKFIKAKLELYFQTFSDFSREREVTIEGDTYKFRYVDLFVNTKFCPRQGANEGANTNSPLHYDPSHYRIRADVGWEFPGSNVNSIMNRPGVVDGEEQLKKALETINKSFYLNLIDHDISIADDGSVTISAEYIAYIEGATGTKIMNALLSREARKLEQEQLKKYEQALADNSCDEKQLSEFRAAIGGARNIGRQKMYQSLTEKLILNDCMYSCFIDKFDRKSFSRESFFYKTPKLKSIPKAEAQSKEEVVKKVKSEIPDGKTQEEKWSYIVSNHLADPDPSLGTKINFFYFADLVYFLMDSLYEEDHSTTFFPEVENIKVILTSFSLSLLGENNKLLTNIGQIPVDLDTFIDWYKGEILDKKIEAISIIDFIKRFFLYLIKDIFQEVCVNTGQHKRLSFKTMSLMAYGRKKGKVEDPLYALLKKELENKDNNNPIMNAASHYSEGKLPLSTSSFDQNKAESSDFFNYMVIFVHYRPDNFVGLGVKSDDESRGVYHFFIGADKGLVKKINFSKSDIQYIRESRMMNQGSNNLLQLSSTYRCSMTMIGNTLLYPGMEIFVNPFGFGGPEFGQPNDGPGTVDIPNLSNIMGIGGYQQVIKVNSTISPGKFETTIDALFIHSGEKKEEISSSSPRGSKPNKNRFKNFCSIEDQAIDTPKAENNVIDCNDTIVDLENLLLDYSQTGNISQPEEEE